MAPDDDWAENPETALRFYLGLTFAQQTALAYVIDWQRRDTRREATAMMQRMRDDYAKAGCATRGPDWRAGLQDQRADQNLP